MILNNTEFYFFKTWDFVVGDSFGSSYGGMNMNAYDEADGLQA